MRALVWAAVLNGIVAVPVLFAMMVVADKPAIMGDFRIGRGLRWGGWATSAVMTIAAALLFVH
jgi:Mn2+/Fe2+ NRAMP family transporter